MQMRVSSQPCGGRGPGERCLACAAVSGRGSPKERAFAPAGSGWPLDAREAAGYNAPVQARLLPSLGLPVLLSACAHLTSAPVAATPARPPEIVIRAPVERVLVSTVIQEKAAGWTLVNQTVRRLIFVRQMSAPPTTVWYNLKPSGAPYVRTAYVLAAEGAWGTRVSVGSELVSNYGTTAESVRPLDSPALRRDQQLALLRVQADVERR